MVASEIKSTMPLPGPRDSRAWVPCGPRGRCEAGGGCRRGRQLEVEVLEESSEGRERRGGSSRDGNRQTHRDIDGDDDNSLSRQSRGRKELLP